MPMKQFGKKLCTCLVCSAMLCCLQVAAFAQEDILPREKVLLYSGNALCNKTTQINGQLHCADLENGGNGDNALYAAQPCTVIEATETGNTCRLTLEFAGGHRVVLNRAANSPLKKGQCCKAGERICTPARQRLCVSVKQQDTLLTAEEIRQQGLLDTVWHGFEQTGYLRTGDGLWANSTNHPANSLSLLGKGDLFTQKPCTVEFAAPQDGSKDGVQLTLRYEDGTAVTIGQDFAPVVRQGQTLSVNTLVGSFADQELTGPQHIFVRIQQNDRALSPEEMLQNRLVKTTIA